MEKVSAPNHFYGITVPGTGRCSRFGKTTLLYFVSRNGSEIVFKTRDGRRFKGKALTNAQGEEVCFLIIDGVKHLVEPTKGYERGRRVTKETLDNTRVEQEWDEQRQCFVNSPDAGMTLREFLAKKAELVAQEKGK